MLTGVRPLLTLLLTLGAVVTAGDLKALAKTNEPGRVVRVTTGSYQFKGWEQPLISGNPNLSHFCWIPVTGYHQGTQRVVQKRGPDPTAKQELPGRRQSPIYIKPIQVSANYLPPREYNPDSGKPVHVPTVAARPILTPEEQAAVKGAIRVPNGQNEVYARIARQQAEQSVAARLQQPPAIAVYPNVAGRYYPRDGWGLLSGHLASKSVHGQIKSKKHR